jgi:glucan biosynthesis protein C
VASVALAIAVTSFTAHLAFPVGSEQFHVQLGMFPQYVILFSLGVAAGRRGWLETLTPGLERRCGVAGAVTALAVPVVLLAGGFFDGEAGEVRFAGGWHWQRPRGRSRRECSRRACRSGRSAFFRRRANHLGRLARRMAPAAYGAFILHPPVVVGLAFAVQPFPARAELKFVAVLVVGVAGSFGVAGLAARVGAIARIIGSGRPAPRPVRA